MESRDLYKINRERMKVISILLFPADCNLAGQSCYGIQLYNNFIPLVLIPGTVHLVLLLMLFSSKLLVQRHTPTDLTTHHVYFPLYQTP
jgi:hypothetical protein